MAFDSLGGILADLLIFALSLTGYSIPAELPEVAFVPHAELQRTACDRPCEVYGWYPLGPTIYLDDRLDPIRDAKSRSILLHELVHYLQNAHGAFSDQTECRNWAMRERQAYRIQARWLAKQGIPALPFAGPGPAPWTLAGRQVGTED